MVSTILKKQKSQDFFREEVAEVNYNPKINEEIRSILSAQSDLELMEKCAH